jgi:hypothetical protein
VQTLPIAAIHARQATERHAHSARPTAPTRHAPAARPADHHAGATRRAVAQALRRSADRLAPAIE